MNAHRGLVSFLLAAVLACAAGPSLAAGAATCTGKFPNPITDICWSCILPISIGSARIANFGDQEVFAKNKVCRGHPSRRPYFRAMEY